MNQISKTVGSTRNNRRPYYLLVATATLLAILPLTTSHSYTLNLFFMIFLHITLAVALDLLVGYAGQIPFGYVMFFGIGAYTCGGLWLLGLHPVVGLFVGGIAASISGIPLGLITFRLRGAYFALATLGVAEILKTLILEMDSLGGASGLTFPLPATYSKIPYYYASLILSVVTILVAYRFVRSKYRFALVSIREDQDAAEACGVNPFKFKLITAIVSSFFAGAAGGLFTFYMFYISPFSVFEIGITSKALFAVLLGGMGTIWGPIVGALILTLLSEITTYVFLELHFAAYGVFIILVMFYMPRGIWGFIESWMESKKIKS